MNTEELNPDEEHMLCLFAKGRDRKMIENHFNKTRGGFQKVYESACKKTGFNKLVFGPTLAHWMRMFYLPKKRKLVEKRFGPTPAQMEVMRMHAEGMTSASIADAMSWHGHHRMTQVSNAITQGCRRAGIFAHEDRKAAIRRFLNWKDSLLLQPELTDSPDLSTLLAFDLPPPTPTPDPLDDPMFQ